MRNEIHLCRPAPFVIRQGCPNYRYDQELERTVKLVMSRMDNYDGEWKPEPGSMEHFRLMIRRRERQRNVLKYQARATSKYHWQDNKLCVHARRATALDGADFDATEVMDRCFSCQHSFSNA